MKDNNGKPAVTVPVDVDVSGIRRLLLDIVDVLDRYEQQAPNRGD